MKKSRLISLILASLISASSLVSCSDSPAQESDTEAETPVSGESENEAETSADDLAEDGKNNYDNAPAVDYGGWEMHIATSAGRDMGHCFSAITVDDLTGDVFNDAIYNRQVSVQDKFNVKIVEHNHIDVTPALIASVTANTSDYAFGFQIFNDEITLFSNHFCIGVSDMPVFDLSQPWWDQGAIEDLSINGKMYYGFSDMGFGHYDSNVLLYYNGKFLTDHHLTSPYDLYKEGKWTMDAMKEMMSAVASDENGDGKMSEADDITGLVGRMGHYMPMLAASNLSILDWDDENGTMIFDVMDEDVMALGDKIAEIILDKSISMPEKNTAQAMFKQGQALFYSHVIGEYRNLRDQEDDYGLITWPTLRENMSGRMYTMSPEAYFIPADCPDEERLATLIDAMNMYSYDYVIDDYVERSVIGKGARDQQSAEIIREHFYKRAFDLASAFGLSSPHSAWNMAVTKSIYASIQQRSSKTIIREVEEIVGNLTDW